MFTFFKKKNKPETESISRYREAIKVINYYMAVEEWEKVKEAIGEVKRKEQRAYKLLMTKLEDEGNINENEKNKQIKEYNSKISQLLKIEIKLEKKEEKFNEKIEKERFKVRFKKIKSELDKLIGIGKNDAALNLLGNFLEENKSNKFIISYYNKEKKIIQKNIEKQKRIEDNKFKENTKLEALRLIGKTVKLDDETIDENEKTSFIQRMKKKFNVYKLIKDKLKKKRLLDEINLLIEEDSKVNREIARKKIANMHKGLIKEIKKDDMLGYDLYGKILGADKISGDTFDINETKEKYNFFLGDATGHGIRAGFIVTLLSRVFKQFVEKSSLQKLTFEINNSLKQNLQSRNFITGVFFEIQKENLNKLKFVGMGHEPMYIFRKSTHTLEKVIPGGLAAGIRIIKDQEHIKVKEFELHNEDIVVTYSDGIIESKNEEGEYYGLERFEKSFADAGKISGNIEKIYDTIIDDLKAFRGGASFSDDTTVLLFKRNTDRDIINNENDEFLQEVKEKEHLQARDIKKLKGKTKNEIEVEIEKIKKQKETKNIIKNLESLYYTGEVLKLKQEAIRYIKDGYIDKKINFYLKKAIANESKYKVEQKEIKVRNKYNILKELYKKGDFETVINEVEDVIAKDGNI